MTTPSAEFSKFTDKVLTIVVNTDQSIRENRNRHFEVPIVAKLREIESHISNESELEQFRSSATLARNWIQSYEPHSKSLVLFAHPDGGVSTRVLNVSLETDVRWQSLPHIQPLIEAGHEFEELLIVLLDGKHTRFLTSFLGNVTEHSEIQNPYPTAHTQAPGNDKTKSQASFHHKADERERQYLRSVAEMTRSISDTRSIKVILVGGNNVSSTEILNFLPEAVRKRVISVFVLPTQAPLKDIAGIVNTLQIQADRGSESAKVASLLDRARGNAKAVAGLQPTLEALTEGRIHELVYAEGMTLKGARCRSCLNVVVNQTACPRCNEELFPVVDGMDLIIATALESGATVARVRGAAAESLMVTDGIGAFLRF